MKRLTLSFLTGSALLLAACATTSEDGAPIQATPFEDEGPSSYGQFLAGWFASAVQDADSAADYFGTASGLEPDSAIIAERAFYSSVLAGQYENAAAAAEEVSDSGYGGRLSRLYLANKALSERRYEDAQAWLDVDGFGPFNAFFAQLIEDWAIAGGGDPEIAVQRARNSSVPGNVAPYLTLHRALLADYAGDYEEANSAYRSALAASPFQRIVISIYGDFLLRQRRRDDAITLYTNYLERQPGERSITAALERAQRSRRMPRRLNAQQMASRALFGPAAALASQTDMDLSVVYLRLVAQLDDDYAPGVVLLAGTLDRIGMPELAIEAYEQVPDGPFRLTADVERVWSLARLGSVEDVLPEAAELAETEDTLARLLYADLLRVSGQYAEAIPYYTLAIDNMHDEGSTPHWRYFYFRAIAYEQSGNWALAEADFQSALELSPNEAEVLNYLGYVWVTRGENIAEAFEMIERAAQLEPEAGHIIDSLGWAHYVRGNYERAVFYLERAVSLSPGAPTLNYHLGDAYWQVGRLLEARFAWERALTLEPDDDERIGLMARLAGEPPETMATQVAENGAETH